MALGKIAKILTAGLTAPYRRVRINLVTEYKWGSGWSSHWDSEAFWDAMNYCFGSNGWSVRPADSSGGCMTVRKRGQYLYLHPMEITGYIRPETLTELREILSLVGEDVIHSRDDGTLGDEVYSLDDCDVVRLFATHKKEVWDAIAPIVSKTNPDRLDGTLFDTLLRDAVIPRNNELCAGVLTSSMVEYGMLINEAMSLLEVWGRNKKATVA